LGLESRSLGGKLRIGITGSAGLIGRSLLRHLESTKGPHEISKFSGNILDLPSAEAWSKDFSPTTVFHLAAKVPSRVEESAKAGVLEVNGHAPALFASAIAGVLPPMQVKFVFVSTSHVYSHSPRPISETDQVSPLNFYGQTKFEGEERLRLLERQGVIRLAVMRLFSVYSEEQSSEYLYGSLLRKIQMGQPEQSILLPGWNNIRDFIHADEAGRKIGELGLTNFEGLVNVGSGRGLSVKDFAEAQFRVKLLPSNGDKEATPTMIVANVALMNQILKNGSVSEE